MSALLAWAWVFTLPGLILTGLGVPLDRRRAGIASVPGPLVLLVVAAIVLASGDSFSVVIPGWLPFLPDGAFRSVVDPLSALLLTIVGFVASLVYIYSLGYMADDAGRRRFFVYLDLFVATMAILVLAGNLAVLLIGWTGVGVSSFLLITFYRNRDTIGAGLQALAANAIGDGALLLAATTLPTGCGAFATLGTPACGAVPGGVDTLAWLLFIAAAAKSAQGPLYFWLPNAMAGPTPISALIHAATMVAAGVYLLARSHAVLELSPSVSMWIAIVGVVTALGGSIGSLFQANFKKGIAYSTVAQIGYMFAGVGVGAPFAGLFHLFTHASFKALLFLAAGIVIHGAGGREALAGLRGLGKLFPYSRWGFLVGSLALIGTPIVTAGSFSKDAIIEGALASHTGYGPVVGYLLLAGVLLTGLYTGRLFGIVYGASAVDPHVAHHDSAAERPMNAALIPLIIGSIAFGYLGGFLDTRLSPVFGNSEPLTGVISVPGLIAFALGAIGFVVAYVRVVREPSMADHATSVEPSYRAAPWVGAISEAGYAVSRGLGRVQSGALATYVLGSFVGVALILLVRETLR